MNRETIIQMAREAGFEVHERKQQARVGIDALIGVDSTAKLERFAALVAASEREECAKVCESFRDVREEARAALRVADALESGDQDRMLSALGHDSDVRLYHSGLDKSAAAIRARGEAV